MGYKNKTTMSVSEMREMLGLGKTDSYWIVKKKEFETVMVNGRMRVVIDSFEKWYANQIKHRKVNGPPPGKQLMEETYSPQEVAELLNIADSVVYDILSKGELEYILVDFWKRIPKDSFRRWYKSQDRYRLPKDRERDMEMEKASITMPHMARLLGIPRKEAYAIARRRDTKECFEIVEIAGKKRVTKESFENWYKNQTKYQKIVDVDLTEYREVFPVELLLAGLPEVQKAMTPNKPGRDGGSIIFDTDRTPNSVYDKGKPGSYSRKIILDDEKKLYTVKEIAGILDVTEDWILRQISYGELEAVKIGKAYRIQKTNLKKYLREKGM